MTITSQLFRTWVNFRNNNAVNVTDDNKIGFLLVDDTFTFDRDIANVDAAAISDAEIDVAVQTNYTRVETEKIIGVEEDDSADPIIDLFYKCNASRVFASDNDELTGVRGVVSFYINGSGDENRIPIQYTDFGSAKTLPTGRVNIVEKTPLGAAYLYADRINNTATKKVYKSYIANRNTDPARNYELLEATTKIGVALVKDTYVFNHAHTTMESVATHEIDATNYSREYVENFDCKHDTGNVDDVFFIGDTPLYFDEDTPPSDVPGVFGVVFFIETDGVTTDANRYLLGYQDLDGEYALPMGELSLTEILATDGDYYFHKDTAGDDTDA